MRTMLWTTTLTTLAILAMAADDERVLPIPNGGFEDELKGWTLRERVPMCSLSAEQAASGRHSLKVLDTHPVHGSGAVSTRVAVDGAGAFELRGKVYAVRGSGLGMYVRSFDKDGKPADPGSPHLKGLGGTDKRWRPFRLTFYTTDQAAHVEVSSEEQASLGTSGAASGGGGG